jgi:hypothetical protein
MDSANPNTAQTTTSNPLAIAADRPPQAPPPTAPAPRELQAHPLADIFPPAAKGDDFQAFIEDIKTNGQRQEIVILNGEILDGRRRYAVCRQLGLTPKTRQFDPRRDGESPRDFVLSMNLHRRHLSTSQRAMIAAKYANLKVGANQHSKEGPSIEEASKLLNVGQSSVERAAKVIEDGVPELVAMVEKGQLPASVAAKLTSKAPDDQKVLISKGKAAIIAAVGNTNTPTKESVAALITGQLKKLDLSTARNTFTNVKSEIENYLKQRAEIEKAATSKAA